MRVLVSAALQGLTVLDSSTSVAGGWAAALLQRAGARVLRVGDQEPLAHLGPHAVDGSSLLARHLRSGVEVLARRPDLDGIDVWVHDGHEAPLDGHPRLVTCAVADFPATGRYAGWRGGELVQQALSGLMHVTGRADREPLHGVGHRAAYATGTTAACSVVAALVERERSGRGQHVSATAWESAAAMAQNLVSQHSYNGTSPERERYAGLLGTFRCADGAHVVVFLLAGWDSVCRAFDVPDLAADDRFATLAGRFAHWPDALARLAAAAATLTSDDLIRRAQRERFSAERVVTPSELVASPQWTAREMVAAGPGGHPRLVGPVRTVSTWDAPGEPAWWARGGRPGPLAGVRVVDLTTAWAGPFAGRSLAWLGAEVVKVESPTHLDSWRMSFGGSATERFPDREPGAAPWDRNVLFTTQNQGKASLGLDLKAPGGLDVALRLVAASDVVLSNVPPGVTDRLGLGEAAVRAASPGAVVVEMPAYGSGGPQTHHVGMGKTMEAACGMASLIGYGDGVPVLSGPAHLDPIGGLHGTLAVLLGLLARARHGTGSRTEVAQTEAAALWVGEYLLAALEDPAVDVPPPAGNRSAVGVPHVAVRGVGDDAWLAVAVDDAAWPGWCAAVDRPDLAADPALATVAGRRAREDELEKVLAAWAADRDPREAAAALQAAGVPAAPVLSGADVATDGALVEAGFVHRLAHPAAGVHDYPGLAFRVAGTPGPAPNPAPCFGADNDRVLRELVGASADEVARWRADGAVADRPDASVEGL